MSELTDDVIHDIARDLNIDYGDDDQYIMDFARSVIAADRELQSARHAEELAAYALTVANLRAACDKFSEAEILALKAAKAAESGEESADVTLQGQETQPEHDHNCSTHYHARGKCDCVLATPARKPMTTADIDTEARKAGATAYTNRFVTGSAFTFGPETLARFVRAVEAFHGIKEKP